jgi:hypothetical protein
LRLRQNLVQDKNKEGDDVKFLQTQDPQTFNFLHKPTVCSTQPLITHQVILFRERSLKVVRTMDLLNEGKSVKRGSTGERDCIIP